MSNHDIPCRGCGEDQRLLGLSHEANCLASKLNERDLVPGVLECAKCRFSLVRTNLYVQSGTFGPGDSKTEPCPNGCGPLWPVTWKQQAEELMKRCEELSDRTTTAESRLEVVSKEVEAMEALLEKATNDVSAWKSRASGAESRLDAVTKQWTQYRAYLEAKYPAKPGETWQFTCPEHLAIQALLVEKL